MYIAIGECGQCLYPSVHFFEADPQPHDVLLMDQDLGDDTGLSLAKTLRASGCSAQMMVMSTSVLSAQAVADAGCVALQKPVRRTELLRVIADAPAPEMRGTPTLARRMKILAAEDNKTNRLVFSKLVKSLEIELVFANNGKEALELFQSFQPDLIFMDISMPEMDGKEATVRIREIETDQDLPRTTIVALTAHAMDGDDHGILAAGLDHYLTKPLKKDAIFDRIRQETPTHCIDVFPD